MKYSRPYKYKCKWWRNRNYTPENKNGRRYSYDAFRKALAEFSMKVITIKYKDTVFIGTEDKHI